MNSTSLYEEKGKITFQKDIDSNKKQYTYSASGTINGIEVTDTGSFVFEPKRNNAIIDEGAGKITTKDGSEIADYTFNDAGNGTDYQGSLVFSTNSKGKLSFLNDTVATFKGTYKNGDFTEEGYSI
jgi:hypothetical protein